MSINLNAPDEYREQRIQVPLYKEFPGKAVEQIPLLVAEGRNIIAVYHVMDRRISPKLPEQTRNDWKNKYVHTIDSLHRFKDGSAKIVLDDPCVVALNEKTVLDLGAAVLSGEAYESLTGKNVLYLAPEKVRNLHGKVYTEESVKDSELWNFVARDNKRLSDYADKMFPEMKSRYDYEEGMGFYFDEAQNKHTMRAWCIGRLGYWSDVDGGTDLGGSGGRFVGLAPEALQTKTSEAGAQKISGEIINQHLSKFFL